MCAWKERPGSVVRMRKSCAWTLKLADDDGFSCLAVTAAMASDAGCLLSADHSLCLVQGPDSAQPFLCGVGTGDAAVQCHTDLDTCCSVMQGPHRGDWYFPNGTRLPFYYRLIITESRQAQRVDLRRTNNGMEPTGIYHCDIETEAVHDNGMRETVYVELYTSDGGKYKAPPLPTIKGYVLILFLLNITHLVGIIQTHIYSQKMGKHCM